VSPNKRYSGLEGRAKEGAQEDAQGPWWWRIFAGEEEIMQEGIEQNALELLQAIREHHPDRSGGIPPARRGPVLHHHAAGHGDAARSVISASLSPGPDDPRRSLWARLFRC
jgi:hypothetical protein